MIKGSAVVKTKKARKWAQIYRDWYESRHDTMIVHCPDAHSLNYAWRSAIRFRETNGLSGRFSISRYDGDLYLMRIGNQTYAMEVYQDKDCWVYYYNSEKEIEIDD